MESLISTTIKFYAVIVHNMTRPHPGRAHQSLRMRKVWPWFCIVVGNGR